ncbi:MAG: pyrroline-5-carboxylate reductase, partial [Lachnospiraceae bacterium]|nr:pyrroline-5-carboxylate reductase [Lachnospiraceae bacterium]
MENIGFIGMGNMAKALAGGFIKSGKMKGENVFAYAPHQDKLKENAKNIGFTPVASLQELVESADTIIMACKPFQIDDVLQKLVNAYDRQGNGAPVVPETPSLLDGKALISIAAGWDFDKYAEKLSDKVRIQFVMPNTPAMVGAGVMLFEDKNSLKKEERVEVKTLFAALGMVADMPTNLMGIGGAVTGCGPAFVDMMIEAYADAAVKYGLPRGMAYPLISQMILGSARLQLVSGLHPGALKDQVTSPAGT